MAAASDRFVPKVHPATRPVEPEDPMTLNGVRVAGDPEVMLRCLVQEYAWLGWDAWQILRLFHDPAYPALGELCRVYGEAALRDRVAELLHHSGVFRVRGWVSEEPDPDEPDEAEPEMVELGIRSLCDRPAGPGGSSHADGL